MFARKNEKLLGNKRKNDYLTPKKSNKTMTSEPQSNSLSIFINNSQLETKPRSKTRTKVNNTTNLSESDIIEL